MSTEEITFTIIFTTLIILLLVSGIILAVNISVKERLQKTLEINDLKLSYQKELLLTQSEISENILSNISRELHDNIGQQLTYLYLQLENLNLEQPALEDDLSPIKQTITNATGELRSLSHSLNTDFVKMKGFLHAYKAEVGRLQQLKKPHFSSSYNNEPVLLDDNQQLIAFRIFQEMVNNALRHSRAGNISIALYGGKSFSLECRDDGKGFDMSLLDNSSGTGLANMKKRAEMAGLMLDIQSIKGSGSHFRLRNKD